MPRIFLVFIILLSTHVARAEDEPGNLAGEAEAAPPLSQFEFDSEISQLQAELRAQRDLADLRLKALETEIHTISGYTERLLLGFLIAGGLVVFVVLYTMSKQTSVNNERMRNLIREADNALDTLHRFTERPEAENFQVSRKLNHIMNKFRERESLSLPQKEMADIYAAAEDPTLPVTLHIQANALRAEVSGDWATAIELWERLLALDSSLPEILLHLAQNYKRLSEVTTDASVERLRMASLEYFQKYSVRTSVHTHSERELRKTGRIGNEKISEHSHNQPALAPSPYPSAPQLDSPVTAPAARTPAAPATSKPSMTQTLLSRQDEGAPSASAATQKIVKQVKETVVDGVTRAQEFIDEAKEKAAQEAKAATEAAARKAKEKAEAIRAEKARQEAEAKAAAEAEAKEKAAAAKRLAKAKAKAAADAKREQEEAARRAEEEKRAKQEAEAQAKKEAAAKAKAAAEEQAAAAAKREKEERKAAAKQAKAAKRAAAKAAAAKAAQDQAAQEQAEAAAAKAEQERAAQEQAEAEAATAKAAQEQAEAEAAAAQAAAEQQAKEQAEAAARQAEEEQRQAAEAEAAAQEVPAEEEQPAAEPEPAAPARVYEEVIVSSNGMPIETIHKSFKSRLDKASEYFGRFHQTKSRTEKKEWLMAAVEEFKLASKYKYSHDMVQLWGATLMEMGSFDSGSLTEHAREAAVVYAEGNRHFDDAFCNELALCYAALGNEAECRKAMETGLGKQMLNPAIILEMSEFDKFKPRPWFQEIASTLGS